MLQISAFTQGTFVSSLDVQSAIFESEVRGSSLWLDVYRPKDQEITLFQRSVHESPATENSFVFPLAGFNYLKRLIVSRTEADNKVTVVADATVLFANDLIITIRQKGFRFSEMIEFLMKYNDKKMPDDPHGLYDLLPMTYFGVFAGDMAISANPEFHSVQTDQYSDDIVILPQLGWHLREITIAMPALLTESDSNTLTMSLSASAQTSDKMVSQFSTSSAALISSLIKSEEPAESLKGFTTRRKKPRPALIVKRGQNVGETHYLDKSPFRMGRDSENDLPLMLNGVSRRHALITVEGDKITLTDLGSTNGTYVNSKRVQQATLKPGDEIFIGTAVLSFEIRE